MNDGSVGVVRVRTSARLRLALSYALFLVAAGFATLAGVYVVLRYVPNYPLTNANPSDDGLPIASRGDILNALVGMSGVILVALAVIGVVGGWILAGWILRPLRRLNDAARIAATGRLDHRIALAGRNDEFRQLADTFDHMLDRLHDAFATQERFAANASHELRTPLAVTATLLDVARKAPEVQDYPALLERLSITNARAIGLIEALLRLADANAITAAAEPVDLAAFAHAAVAENTQETEREGVALELQLEAAPTVGDATLLAQLAVNLVQNAIRHNTSPGIARIVTARQGERATVTLVVENTGVAYTAEAAAQLSDPFLRGSGRVTRQGRGKGYGLGLAIVSRIVAVHDGTLTVAPREAGGLVVTVTLPDGSRERAGRRTR